MSFQDTILKYSGTPHIGRTICTSITICDKFRLPILVAATTVDVHTCVSCVPCPAWIRLLTVIWMPRVRYRLHVLVPINSIWTLAITRPAYLTAPWVSTNAKRTTKSASHGFGSTLKPIDFFFYTTIVLKIETYIYINHVSDAMVRETVPTERTRSKVSAPRDIAAEEHSSAPIETVRRRPQFVMASTIAGTGQTRKTANYHAQALNLNANQTEGVYWIRGSVTVNLIVKTVATKIRRCAVSAFS